MADEFCHRALRGVVAQLCHSLGWHSIHSNSCDVLAELMSRYILSVARTTTSYSTHANRVNPNLLDLQMAFHDLNISLPQLLEYVQEVNAGQLPHSVGRFPTPKPQCHLYTGPGAKIKRRSAKVTSVQSQGEEGGDEVGSEGEEEEDSETESIPGYLPPLPKTKEDSENGDAESGIGEGVSDLVTTPTAVKSPPNPNAGLPTYYRQLTHSVSEEEGGSRRSSISEGTPSNGHTLLPSQDAPVFGAPEGSLPVSITKVTHTDTTHSTPEPVFQSTSSLPAPATAVTAMEISPPRVTASKDPSPPGRDVVAKKMTPTPSPPLSPSPSPPPPPLPSPPKSKSVAVSRALSPAVPPMKPETKKEVKHATSPHDETKEKPKETHVAASDNSSKVAPPFTQPSVPSSLSFTRYTKRPPPLQPATPPRMPQLHRMSPITPSSPPSSSPLHLRAAPTLSPLTKTSPYSFMTSPNPPVLHRLGRTLSDPPRGELTRRPSDTSLESPILPPLPPSRTVSSDPGVETAQVYALQHVKKFEPEKDDEGRKSPADVEIYLSTSPANSESSASLSTSLSPVPSLESSPIKPSSPVRPASQTGFVLATDTVLSPSSPILHSPTTSLSSSSSFSSSSLSFPPEIQSKSTFEPEYPEVSKDVHEPFIQSLPEPTLSESSNESDSDSSVDHTEYPPVGGLGKGQGIHTEESRHIQEYPDVHKGAQVYTEHPVLERKRSFSPSSESSVESVPKQPLKVSISRLKIDGQTSYAVQPSPSQPPKQQQPMATHLSPTGDPGTATSPGLQVSSSSYQKVRSIRPPPSTRPGLTVSMTTTKITTPRLEPPPASLVVSFLRRNLHLGKFRLTPSPVSEESVRVTIPKSIFMSDKRVKKSVTGSRKRERESLESEHKIMKEPKKVKITHHPPTPPPPPRPVSPSSSSSSSSSDSSSEDSSSDSDDNSASSSSPPAPPPLLDVSRGPRSQQLRRSQTHSSDDALSGSSDSSSLRLKLKIGQQPIPSSDTGLRQKRQPMPMLPSRPKSKKQATPKSQPSSSSGLMIHSSTPVAGNVFGKKKKKVKQEQPSKTMTITTSKQKLVPRLTLTKVSAPLPMQHPPPPSSSLASSAGGGEVYICPTCGRQDDGTPMIACDKCDIWYHMRCVGLMCAPPGDDKWFCPKCVKKKKTKKRRSHN